MVNRPVWPASWPNLKTYLAPKNRVPSKATSQYHPNKRKSEIALAVYWIKTIDSNNGTNQVVWSKCDQVVYLRQCWVVEYTSWTYKQSNQHNISSQLQTIATHDSKTKQPLNVMWMYGSCTKRNPGILFMGIQHDSKSKPYNNEKRM